MTTTVILRGEEAVHYAEVHNLKLHRDATDAGPASSRLSVAAARKLLEEHPEALWVKTHIGINSADPD